MAVTYAAPHLLMTFHGGLPGGESWSVGLRTQAADLTEDKMQPYADYAADCFLQFWKSTPYKTYINTGTTFVGATVRLLTTAGVTQFLAEGMPVGSPIAGTGTQAIPNQCALVATLVSAKAGRSGKGRIYLPLTALNSSLSMTDGSIGGGIPSSIGGQVTLLIAALNGNKDVFGAGITKPVPTSGFRIAVQSGKAPGAQSAVTSVSVGSIIDTQRGRRSKLVEVRAVTAVPTPIFIG